MKSFKSFIAETTKKAPGVRVRRVMRRIRRSSKGQIVVQRNKRVRGSQMKGYRLIGTALRRMTYQEKRARSKLNPARRRGFRKAKTKSSQRLRRWKQSMTRRQGW